jgi:hypothetical protein
MATDDQRAVDELPRSLTTLSPVRPERMGELRRRLAFVAYTPGVGRPLLELGTVQYARWTVFSHLPSADGSGDRGRLGWSYLLFDATYDGSKQQYVEAFSDILPLRLTKLFGTCFGFESMVESAPGSDRRVVPARAFGRFIDDNTLPMEPRHFWCANPDSVAVKRQAIGIERATRRADRASVNPIGSTEYEVHSLALGLPTTRPSLAEATFEPWRRRVRPAKAVNPLVLTIPLRRDRWERIKMLRLGPLPHTHFARVVLIPATMQQHLGHVYPDRLERDYLLFSCDHDGTQDSYLTTLLGDEKLSIHRFFEHCEGFPGVDRPYELRRWVLGHRLDIQYYLAGLPARAVQEYADLVKDRRVIANVIVGGAEGLEDA